MRISVIGCGYLGAVHAAAMTELGHHVIGIDTDDSKIALLAAARPPFFEPGLPELLTRAIASGRLTFSANIEDAATADIHFIAVGTPQQPGSNAADLTFVNAAIRDLLPHLKDGDLIVGKSTVPVGTAARLAHELHSTHSGITLAWNPEFLREGFAVADTLTPDRIVYGVPAGRPGEHAVTLLNTVYATALAAGTPLVVTDYATAELVKVAANAFLATKISFINAMAEIAEATGANIIQLADAIGLDDRIGRKFLNAGAGFGGGCLPKDIRAFTARAEELGAGHSVTFLKEIDTINLRARQRIVTRTTENLAIPLTSSRIAVLGLSFKPNSDDVRDSPALDIATRLYDLGATVTATDPEAIPNARTRHPHLTYTPDLATALRDADAVILATEWDTFKTLDPVWALTLVRTPLIIDARNALNPAAWRAAGWNYIGVGQP